MSLVKSKKRVADHGEVFTPGWMVEAMLDLVKGETERIDSRFLEPACGDGNFLVSVLRRKLAAVELKYGKSPFERRHYALLALMCIYGIELLQDNIAECRANLLGIFSDYLSLDPSDEFYRAAVCVLSQNLIHGDALTMRVWNGSPITFAEWGYLWNGRFQRRDFRLDIFTESAAFSAEGSLFAHLGKHEIFTPSKTYPPTNRLVRRLSNIFSRRRNASRTTHRCFKTWEGFTKARTVLKKWRRHIKNALRSIPMASRGSLPKKGGYGLPRAPIRASGGKTRPDAVMYCLSALQLFKDKLAAEIRKITFEIATLGMGGIDVNDPARKYSLRSLPGNFSGLQLLCTEYVGFKQLDPSVDLGFDLSVEYAAAQKLMQ